MNEAPIEVVSVAVAASEAAVKIKEALPKNQDGTVRRTDDSEVLARIGEIVDEAVGRAGGDASALLMLTNALSTLVPYGGRVLRSLRSVYCRQKAVDGTAAVLFELLAGDPAADFVEIGKRIDGLLRSCDPTFEPEVMASLGEKLQMSVREIRDFHDAYLVSVLGGAELARLVPSSLPYPVLADFAPILGAGLPPWRAQSVIVRAVEEVARRRLEGKAVAALVDEILAEEAVREVTPLPVIPAWSYPVEKNAIQPAA